MIAGLLLMNDGGIRTGLRGPHMRCVEDDRRLRRKRYMYSAIRYKWPSAHNEVTFLYWCQFESQWVVSKYDTLNSQRQQLSESSYPIAGYRSSLMQMSDAI